MLLYLVFCYFCFFFFKQKTAYEMRISDWSSDVCSSDLSSSATPIVVPSPGVAGEGANGTQPASDVPDGLAVATRSEEHTSELQSLMRISYAVFCLKKKK